jgi:excinuclease ABC subunit B
LTAFLREEQVRVKYLHSDIDTVERLKILKSLRKGEFDVLVGINLLREGLDLPEVSLIAILDADKEGFLRSTTSLIQMIGRAARNVNGHVIMYADEVTESMHRAVEETNRRRSVQQEYNRVNGITPQSIRKDVRDVIDTLTEVAEDEGLDDSFAEAVLENKFDKLKKKELEKLAEKLEKDMKQAAAALAFEEAARLRDLLVSVRGKIGSST